MAAQRRADGDALSRETPHPGAGGPRAQTQKAARIPARGRTARGSRSVLLHVALDQGRLGDQQADPLAGLSDGTFKTSAFQSLYDSLVATSQVSLIEALTVGLEIEELGIRDIIAQKENVDNPDILKVYDNLHAASRNHLRAFMKTLVLQGGSYVPKYIPQSEFNAIVSGA